MKKPMKVIAIGNFDGVHRGHRHLFQLGSGVAGDLAAYSAGHTAGIDSLTAVTFEPLPIAVLKPDRPMGRLTPAIERAELLRSTCGVTDIIELTPTAELLGRSAEAFIEQLRGECPFDVVVEGPDFRFGRNRSGSLGTLRELGAKHGFAVIEAAPLTVTLTDGSTVEARSSVARALLEQGRVADAACVFGRAYELRCLTVQGDQRGRTLGWPTANLNTHGRILPADGVYAGEATLPDGRCVIAAISIGTKPTCDGMTRTCESTLLAADGQAIELPLDWYGWNIRLRFMSWIRAQERFDSVHTLLDELERDRARIIRAMSVSRAV